MSSHEPAPTKSPRLIFSALTFVIALTASLVFASAFKDGAASNIDPTLCGTAAPLQQKQPDAHASHSKKEAKPPYYIGGLWTPEIGLAGRLDAAMLSASAGKPIVCQTAIADEDSLIIINRTPIQLIPVAGSDTAKPNLVLSVDYAGRISSMEYPGAGLVQQYITSAKDQYNKILVIEAMPGNVRDPDEDWSILDGDVSYKPINFFTPSRKATPSEVLNAVYKAVRDTDMPASSDVTSLIQQLGSGDPAKLADIRWQLSGNSPYSVVPKLKQWLAASTDENRERRVYEALVVRQAMGIHADELIAEAAASDNPALRALAARVIGTLADDTTDPIGLLTRLAEDKDMAVRYEALVATRAMPGRVAAGVAQLVEPYEMSDAMRTLYRGTMEQMLAYGEPVPADSRANRLRRMAISELINEDRDALVCAILLERTDLPDEKIDEVLGQLAEVNGRGPLVALLNLLETMNPSTLAKREILLKKLITWKANELNAQTPRLKEMALGNGSDNLRQGAAAAMIMSSPPSGVLTELGDSPVVYEALTRVTDQAVLKRWASSIMQQAKKATPTETAIAAIDAARLLPAGSITSENGTMLLRLAKSSDNIDLRFAAIRAVNALPADVKPDGTEQLTLTSLEIRAQAGMKYDKESLTVTAGRPVELLFINPDTMEHNLVITLPGRAQEIGVAMSADPTAAAAIGYVPQDSDAVLHYTRMLKPGESQTLRFIAPTKPGTYDYVCTFPGHYGSMKGVLEVIAP